MSDALKTITERPDIEALTMQLHQLTGVSVSLYGLDGSPLLKPHAASMCNMFIESNADARCACHDTIKQAIADADGISIFRCPHGFHYASIPIEAGNERSGALILHDFILGEVDDTEHRLHAMQYGFDESAYLESVHGMSRLTKGRVLELARMFRNLVSILSQLSWNQSRLEEMREAMQESIGFYISLMQHNHAILLILDITSGEVYDASLGAEEFYGYSQEELRGMPLKAIAASPSEELLERLRNPQKVSSRLRRKHRLQSGAVRDVDMQCTRVELQGRQLVLATVQDVTKEVEEEERRRETEMKLQQAQKLEALGTLASGIAHDFNNILSAMIGYTEFSKLQLDADSDVQAHLDEIMKAGERAKDLVNQILTFSHQVKADPRPVDVGSIVKEALKLLRMTIPTTIQFHRRFDKTTGSIIADPTQIHQIMMNLCTNAHHAIHPHAGEITIELAPVEVNDEFFACNPNMKRDNRRFARLSVTDTGCGMDEETIQRIYDPFFTTKREGKGTGLGLATVYGIVDDLGGCIEVTSKPGEGSRFDVYLPQEQQAEDRKAKQKTLEVVGGGEHVLIIDDEESIISIGRLLLQKMGYKVTAMQSSEEAVELFRANPHDFDAILTDFAMPGLNGFMVADQATRIRPDIPVFMITGYSDELTDDFDSHGVTRILHKPIDWKIISHVIQEHRDSTR